jgi:hypothetical protein
MFSSTTTPWLLLGIVILIVVIVVWKWWKSPSNKLLITEHSVHSDSGNENNQINQINQINQNNQNNQKETSSPPPMVFAINDNGNLDLTDINGKILNIGYGPNPKTYIGLLDIAEKDTEKKETANAGIFFMSKVGNTKLYQVVGRPYIINYTRLHQ